MRQEKRVCFQESMASSCSPSEYRADIRREAALCKSGMVNQAECQRRLTRLVSCQRGLGL